MGETPVQTNQGVKEVDLALKALINDVVIAAAKASAKIEAPWLAWPVVSGLFDLLMNWIGGYVYKAITDWTTIGVIDVQTWIEKSDYESNLHLLQVARDQAVQRIGDAAVAGNQEKIDATKKSFKAAFERLVRWDGIAPT